MERKTRSLARSSRSAVLDSGQEKYDREVR